MFFFLTMFVLHNLKCLKMYDQAWLCESPTRFSRSVHGIIASNLRRKSSPEKHSALSIFSAWHNLVFTFNLSSGFFFFNVQLKVLPQI